MAPARVTRGLAARLAAVLVLGPLVGGAVASPEAAAARVPLTSGGLLGQSYRTGAITDTFADASGTSLATTVDACGSPWTVTGGTVTVTAAQTVRSATNALVTATVPLCDSAGVNADAGGDVRSGSAINFGVLVNAAAGGRPSTAAVLNTSGTGTLSLQRIPLSGAPTTWTSITGVGNASSARHLRVTYIGGVYTVFVNGTALLTHTVTDPTTRATVEANRQVGFAAFSDTNATFDNFQGFPR